MSTCFGISWNKVMFFSSFNIGRFWYNPSENKCTLACGICQTVKYESVFKKESFVNLRGTFHFGLTEAVSNSFQLKRSFEEQTYRPLHQEPKPEPREELLVQSSVLQGAGYNTRAFVVNDELVNHSSGRQFSILSPYYHFTAPERLVNAVHMHPAANEHFFWRNELSISSTPACCDIYQHGVPLVTPPSISIPEKVKEPYQCDQCGKIFKTKYTLAIHLKMPNHTHARPFVCNTCGKGFRLSSTLCRHKIIHTKEKPYKCHVCEKAFNRSSTLKTHIRTHSDDKEFVCDRCGKGFHQKGNLRNHFLIHTGEKPYKCSLCQKAFNKLSNLKFHMHVHTDNSPYRCKFCKVSFSRRCDLKSHIQNAHVGQDAN